MWAPNQGIDEEVKILDFVMNLAGPIDSIDGLKGNHDSPNGAISKGTS